MNGKRNAFTLIELLVVILIMALLAVMLFPAVGGVMRAARGIQTMSEVKGLAAALEAYYAEYRQWPPVTLTKIPDPERNAVKIEGTVAKMLQGGSEGNSKKIQFMQFRKCADTDGEKPMNPYWKGATPSNVDFYYYKVDKNFDNIISVGATKPPNSAVKRSVLVWTWNADKRTNMTSAD